MLGIAYAQRSLKGATRGSESGNLPRRYQAAWFRFDGTLPPQSGAAPLGLFAALTVCRAAPQRLGSRRCRPGRCFAAVTATSRPSTQ